MTPSSSSSSSSSSSCSLFLIFTILFSSLHSLGFATTLLIQQACKNCSKIDPNTRYNFCVASFQSNPRSQLAKDLHELGLISIKITRHNVTDTYAHINDLLQKNNDKFIKACLNDCHDVYSDTISTFREAIRHYKAKRYTDCNVKLSSIMDASTTCEDGFVERYNGSISLLKKRNEDIFQLSSIALSIVNMLIKTDT